MKVLIINGSNGSGKDTLVEMFQEVSYVPAYNYSTIDTVKKLAQSLGWNGAKDEKGRRLLSELKAAWIQYNGGPLAELRQSIKETRRSERDSFFLFVHVREPEEMAKIKEAYGDNCQAILVYRNDGPKPARNPADLGVNGFKYDVIIPNNGTLKDLRQHAQALAKGLQP